MYQEEKHMLELTKVIKVKYNKFKNCFLSVKIVNFYKKCFSEILKNVERFQEISKKTVRETKYEVRQV